MHRWGRGCSHKGVGCVSLVQSCLPQHKFGLLGNSVTLPQWRTRCSTALFHRCPLQPPLSAHKPRVEQVAGAGSCTAGQDSPCAEECSTATPAHAKGHLVIRKRNDLAPECHMLSSRGRGQLFQSPQFPLRPQIVKHAQLPAARIVILVAQRPTCPSLG